MLGTNNNFIKVHPELFLCHFWGRRRIILPEKTASPIMIWKILGLFI